MAGYRAIEPPKRHVCQQPKDMGLRKVYGGIFKQGWAMVPARVKHGTLWKCPDCQLWWVAAPNPMHGRGIYFGGGGLVWNRVGWWSFTLRRRIKAAEAAWAYEDAKAIVDGFITP